MGRRRLLPARDVLLGRQVVEGVVHLEGAQARRVVVEEARRFRALRVERRLPARVGPATRPHEGLSLGRVRGGRSLRHAACCPSTAYAMPVTSEFARFSAASRSRWMLDVSIDSRSPECRREMWVWRSCRSRTFTFALWRMTFSATAGVCAGRGGIALSEVLTTFALGSRVSFPPPAGKTWFP